MPRAPIPLADPAVPRLPAFALTCPRREELQQRFAGKPWLDVLSKADLLEEELDEADRQLQQHVEAQHAAAAAAPTAAAAQTAAASQCSGAAALPPSTPLHQQVSTAVGFAAAVPRALRVSSTSGVGIEDLKAAMLQLIEQQDLAGGAAGSTAAADEQAASDIEPAV